MLQGVDVNALVPFCPAQFNVTHCLYLSDDLWANKWWWWWWWYRNTVSVSFV